MPSFDEIEKFELDSIQMEAFRNLKSNKDFKVFQDFVEADILKMVYALAVGTPVEGEADYLKQLRGFARRWQSLMKRINKIEHEKPTIT